MDDKAIRDIIDAAPVIEFDDPDLPQGRHFYRLEMPELQWIHVGDAETEEEFRASVLPAMWPDHDAPPPAPDLAERLLAKLEELNVIPKGAVKPDDGAVALPADPALPAGGKV